MVMTLADAYALVGEAAQCDLARYGMPATVISPTFRATDVITVAEIGNGCAACGYC